ncbi:baseplate J/gp47 family protein [Clostridium sediminicola]|uniref:baseplate J/gp47 family protein n=1 Tax=Clostridium sediminicola TaxID=3114879 RepID=UPI0031F2021F
MTYEEILKRMLERVPDNIDKREGSIIYNALAPAAFELAQMYFSIESSLSLVFAHTSNGEYLDKRCAEMGVYRKKETKAARKGEFNTNIPIGTRFGIDELTYKVVECIEENSYKMECEKAGEVGNTQFGTLLPIDYVKDLTTAKLTDILIPGEDTETDEELLMRFTTRVQKSSTSGNIYHYLEWANEVDGVGGARILPLWNGNNTLKILVAGGDMQPASSELISSVQEYLDPNSEGLGKGKAPIGAFCTVQAPESITIDISADISGVSSDNVTATFTKKLKEYFQDLIVKDWQMKDSYVVSYAKIGAILLEAIDEAGGIDYSNITVNSYTSNIQMTENIPVVGRVTLNEVT